MNETTFIIVADRNDTGQEAYLHFEGDRKSAEHAMPMVEAKNYTNHSNFRVVKISK